MRKTALMNGNRVACFLACIILGVTTDLPLLSGLAAAATAEAKNPNIVFVFADQMRAQATGYAGNPDVKTPHLDSLAWESVVFRNAVSTCPVCCPYRASLLTGQYPLTHGIFVNGPRLPADAVTLAEAVKDAGYATAYIGKWHLDGQGELIPKDRRQGFDFWRAHECSHNYWKSPYYGDTPEQKTWEGYDAFSQTDCAIEYLKSREGKPQPFCLVVSYGPPHTPFRTAPEEYRAMYDPEKLTLRPNVPAARRAKARKDLAGYYAHITALDACVGRLCAALKVNGQSENTILAFTSDHGEMAESQGHRRKIRPWDESVLIPFLLCYPKRLGSGQRMIDAPFGVPDVMPTLLELADITIPGTVEGKSYAPLLLGTAESQPDAVLIACYHPFANWHRTVGGKEWRGVRTSRYTYVRDRNGPWLLYDNQSDPYQLKNLCGAPKAAKVQASLEETLQKLLASQNDSFESGEALLAKWSYIETNKHVYKEAGQRGRRP